MRSFTIGLARDIVEIRREDGIHLQAACDGTAHASATELLAAALGACIAASLAPLLARHGIEPEHLHLAVAARGGQFADGLAVTIGLPACDAALLERCRRAATRCPVHRALDVPIDLDFDIPPREA